MIHGLIFSKNRPMQLDLLLRSIKDHIPDLKKITVLYKEDEEYHAGYFKVFTKTWENFDLFHMEKEVNGNEFQSMVTDIVDSITEPNIVIFADDDVVINHVDLKKIISYRKPWHASISLSLGENCNYCYAQGYSQEIPKFKYLEDGTIIQWCWAFATPKTDWSYPMTFDGGIYKTDSFKKKIHAISFNSLNYMNGYMDMTKNWGKTYELAFKEQKVYNIAANLVQTVNNNRHAEKFSYPARELNEKFLKGYEIDTTNLYGQIFNSPNGEVEYLFRKNTKIKK